MRFSTDSSPGMDVDLFANAKRGRGWWGNLWFRVAVKSLAFASGCSLALAFGLYDNHLPAPSKAHNWHTSAQPFTQAGPAYT